MSFSESGQTVTEITDRSTIPELIGFLLSSPRGKEFKLVERILIRREEEMERQLKKEQEERGLLEKIHGESELEKLEMEEELKRLNGEKLGEAEPEKLEMPEVLKRLKAEKLEMQEEMKRLKSEILEIQEELQNLKREKQEAEETARLCRQKFPQYEERITYFEKAVAGFLAIDISETGTHSARNSSENDLQIEGNSNLDCKQTVENASNHCENAQTSYGAQSPSNGPWFETNSSHQEKRSNYYLGTGCNNWTLEMKKGLLDGDSNAQIGMEDACDAPKVEINGSNQENENDSSYAAASISINRICNKEFHDNAQLVLLNSTQVVPSAFLISDRPRSPIVVEIIESDDEAPGDEKPHVSNTCTSSKKGVTFMESGRSGCPSQTEDENKSNVMSNPLNNLLPKRKRSLNERDDSGSSSIDKQKTKTVRELLHDGIDAIVNNCSVKLESAATGSQSILPSAQGQMVNKRCQEKAGVDCSLQTASRKLNFDSTDDSSDSSPTDSEDDSDSHIEKMIANLRQDRKFLW